MLVKFKRRNRKTWYIRGHVRGHHVYETTGTADAARAEEYRARREAALWDRRALGRETRTFDDAALKWLEARPRAEQDKRNVARLLEYFGGRALVDIDQDAVDKFCRTYMPKASPQSRHRNAVSVMSAILRLASRAGWCVVPSLAPAVASKARTRFLTPAESDRLLAAAGAHLRPLLTFILYTGARMGEAIYLDWREVDLTHRRVAFMDTKNGTHRGVPLPQAAWLALANLAHRDGPVFRRPDGRPYNERAEGGGQIKTAFRAACRRAGLTDLRPHDLRHTYASWLVQRGVNIRAVGELLGHKTMAMTMRYAHLAPDHLRAAAAMLDDPAPPSQLIRG